MRSIWLTRPAVETKMDEDDGMLLNFAPATADAGNGKKKTGVSGAKITGGRWKERRKAQLMSQNRGRTHAPKKQFSDANSVEVAAGKTPVRTPGSRKREADAHGTRSGPPMKQIKEQNGEFGGKNNSYVSSLFTSNPDIQHKDSEATEMAPSNAPLVDATTFAGLGLEQALSAHLTDHLRFAKPTKIQRSVLPRLLQRDKDLFVQAQTGSGKTLSFVLPIFNKLMSEHRLKRGSGLFALILVPTRELAQQIHSVLETLVRCCHRIVPGIVIGGEKKKAEKARLRKGVNVLVATPGRLADHIDNTETLDLSQLRYLVMDEGDRLMDLGFEETIAKILKKIEASQNLDTIQWPNLPKRRINVLCSATMKSEVKKLGEISLQDSELVTVEDGANVVEFDSAVAPDQLTQQVVVVPPKLRLVTLNALLTKITSAEQPSRTMVFFSCSDSVNFHFMAFTKDGQTPVWNTSEEEGKWDYVHHTETTTVSTAPLLNGNCHMFKLHGSLTQQVRTSTLQQFVNSKENIRHTVIFCTDVASRGLDLPDISNIIEYDPAFSADDHLHRVGRTARAGLRGVSTLFLLPGPEENYVDHVSGLHPSGLQTLRYETLLKEGFVNETKKDNWDYDATTWHLNVERWLLENNTALEAAKQAFISHIRAYATHLSSERSIFNVKLLHLGHLAKSFALRETPKNLGRHNPAGDNNSSKKPKKEDPRSKMLRMAKMAAKVNSSEFNFA